MSATLPSPEQQARIAAAFQQAAEARAPIDAPTLHVTATRRDIRRVLSARELHEAADMAQDGTPLPGTNAHAKLAAAMESGDFAAANQIREAIKGYAPEIRAVAVAAENGTRQATVDATVRAIVDVQTAEGARVKRLRKGAARRRAQDAQMRHAARGD